MTETTMTGVSDVSENPTKILFNIRINEGWQKRLMAAGVPFGRRTLEQDERLEKKHAAEAKAAGRDFYRGNRTDAAGNRRGDSGTVATGWKPEGLRNLCIKQGWYDLIQRGYHPGCVHITQKPGEEGKMSQLRIGFTPEPPAEVDALPEAARSVIMEILGSVWSHTHIYRRNPDGSMTVNVAHRQQDIPADTRDLRLPEGSRFQTIPRHCGAGKEQAASN